MHIISGWVSADGIIGGWYVLSSLRFYYDGGETRLSYMLDSVHH